jgi:peptidylprolyl isomerase
MADPENTILLETSKGNVTIELRPDLAPGHVERIKELAREGFYDGIVFHRVIPGFMAQVGCPKGTGMGGSDKPDLKAEFNAEPHIRGTCSMARTSAPHSANSQFFICFGRCQLPQRAIHRLGQGDRRHGRGRPAGQGRAAAQSGQDRLHARRC